MFSVKSALRHYKKSREMLNDFSIHSYSAEQFNNKIERIFKDCVVIEGKYTIYLNTHFEEKIEGKYHKAIFDLSRPFHGEERLLLFCDVDEKSEHINISLLSDDISLYFYDAETEVNYGSYNHLKQYSQKKEYAHYLDVITDWVNETEDVALCDNEFVKFKTIGRPELLQYDFNIFDFSDEAIFLRNEIERIGKDTVVGLGEVASIWRGSTSLPNSDIDLDPDLFRESWKNTRNQEAFVNLLEQIQHQGITTANKELMQYESIHEMMENSNFIFVEMRLECECYDTRGIVVDALNELPQYRFVVQKERFKEDIVTPICKFWHEIFAEIDYGVPKCSDNLAIENCICGVYFKKISPEGRALDYELQDGDIVYHGIYDQKAVMELYTSDGKRRFANNSDYIIKCSNIDPYYLINYLESDLFHRILSSAKHETKVVGWMGPGYITPNNLNQLPIVLNDKNNKDFDQTFYEIMHLGRNPINTYLKSKKGNSINDILSAEQMLKFANIKMSDLKKVIERDLSELKICYEQEAYKATLILAGSIMEAVLLDWLSERDGVDYAQKGIYIDGRPATLADYIKRIAELEYPDWMDNKKKADLIRKNRNLVHAKLCLKDDVIINKETCELVLKYLNDIIESYLVSVNYLLKKPCIEN